MADESVGATEVAKILGVSRQRALQLASSMPDFPPPEATSTVGRLWARQSIEEWATSHPRRGPGFGTQVLPRPGRPTPRQWEIYNLAVREAQDLNQRLLTENHLLLAMLHPDCPGAARRVLTSFGVTPEEMREVAGEGALNSKAPVSGVLLRAGMHVWIERAHLKAAQLQDEETNSEHLLLSLTDDWGSNATTARLKEQGVSAEAVRERVLALTDEPAQSGHPPRPQSP